MQHFENQANAPPAAAVALPDAMANVTELKAMSEEDLRKRLRDLQPEMDKEIAELRAKYQVGHPHQGIAGKKMHTA